MLSLNCEGKLSSTCQRVRGSYQRDCHNHQVAGGTSNANQHRNLSLLKYDIFEKYCHNTILSLLKYDWYI